MMSSVESLNEAVFAERQAHSQRPLRRYIAVWDFAASNVDEMSLTRGDILLVADEFNDGWMRGLRLGDLEIGFFPAGFVAEDKSPIYKLQELKLSTEYYDSDQKLIEYDSSRRSRIALEICTSEGAYCSKLKMLNEKFIIALCQNTGVISHEDYNAIFSNIQPLLSLSESLLVQLKSRMAAWDDRYTRIGDIFTHMGHHMKLFVTYAVQHTLGSQMLIKISAQEKFRNWLERAELDCQRTLNSLLLEPIQRVPRYELLLKDLLKHTSEEHPDHQTLKEALNFVQKIATDCNENIRKAENELKLLAITKRFPNDDVDVVPARFIKSGKDGGLGGSINLGRRKKRLSGDSTSSLRHSTSSNSLMTVRSFFESEQYRVFVKEGSVMKTRPDFTDPSERYLFLCSDLLLIAQPTSRNRKTFKLKERVLLAHAWITDAGSLTGQIRLPERGFILGTPKKLYHFMAPSPEEKNNWFQELQSKIFAQKRLFNDLLSHLSIPDEQFQCMRMKARVSYLGMLQDELSFKSGDEICVVGFKQGTSKWKPGLYSNEPFDPSPEWYYGTLKGSSGWFPMQCVLPIEGKSLEAFEDELKPTPMCVVLALKQRMAELTGRMVTPLRESERTVKVLMGEGNFKTLRIAPGVTVQDVVRMYFKVKPDSCLTWTLIEQSTDETVNRPIINGEDPCEVVDFWGKSKDNMRFFLQQSLISEVIVASGSEDVSLYS